MALNDNPVRSVEGIKKSLLAKAFDKAAMQREIDRRLKRIHDETPESHRALVKLAKQQDEADVARAIRAFNLIAEKEGSSYYLKDETAKKRGFKRRGPF